MTFQSPFVRAKPSLFASLFGAAPAELFPLHLEPSVRADPLSVPALHEWRDMLSDGRADDFVRAIAVGVSASSDTSEKKSKEVVQEVEVDGAALARICGPAHAVVLRERGISTLRELRGAPIAVLTDLVPSAADADLWPRMAAVLDDGGSWFDADRLRASSRSLRTRSPVVRLKAAASVGNSVEAVGGGDAHGGHGGDAGGEDGAVVPPSPKTPRSSSRVANKRVQAPSSGAAAASSSSSAKRGSQKKKRTK